MSNEQLLKQVRELIEAKQGALEDFKDLKEQDMVGFSNKLIGRMTLEILALRFMEKMLVEPSEGMKSAFIGTNIDSSIRPKAYELRGYAEIECRRIINGITELTLKELSNDGSAYNTASMLKKGE